MSHTHTVQCVALVLLLCPLASWGFRAQQAPAPSVPEWVTERPEPAPSMQPMGAPHTDAEVVAQLDAYQDATLRQLLGGLYTTLRALGWPVEDAWEGVLLAHVAPALFAQKQAAMAERLAPR